MFVESHSIEETLALGRALGRLAPPAPAVTCIALDGPLGAGKTHLTRGIAQGAQIADESLVSSPTYVLLNIYDGPKPVRHLDAYRISSPEDFAELGFEELVAGTETEGGVGGIVVVEWATRIAELLPPDTLWITIAHEGDLLEETRTFTLTAGGPTSAALLAKLQSENAGPKPQI
jgi:tRNA threonylcarbamoyladenosine biosynthesis protein TsaE